MEKVPPAEIAVLLGLLLVLSCSSSGSVTEPVPSPAPLAVERVPERGGSRLTVAPVASPGDAVLARVGGSEIRRSDLGDFAIRYYRDAAEEMLTHLVDERIIDAEASRLSISLPTGLLDREVAAELAARERKVKAEFGPRTTMDVFLRERYGIGLPEHRRDLTRLLRTRLLRDRAIRRWQIETDRVELRDAAFPGEKEARAAAESARAGADLGRLAREKGLRPDVVLPPVPRSEITPPELADAVFALPEGAVSDPIAVTEGSVTAWHVFKMVRRLPSRAGGADEVEAGLASRGIEAWEYGQWAREMRERYGAQVLR